MPFEYPMPTGPVDRSTANLYLQAAWRRYEAEQNRLNQEAAYRAKNPNFADQFVTHGLKAFDDWMQEDRKNRLSDREYERKRAMTAYETDLTDAYKRNMLGYEMDAKYEDAQRYNLDRGRAVQSYLRGRPEDFQSPVAAPLLGMEPREVGIMQKEVPAGTQSQWYDPTMIGKRGAETENIQARTSLTGIQADLAAQRLQWAPEQHAQEMERRAQQILALEQAGRLREAQTLKIQTENEIVDYLRSNGTTMPPEWKDFYLSLASRRSTQRTPQELETNAYAQRYGQNQADRDMPRPQRPGSNRPSGLDQRIESFKQMYRLGVQMGKFPQMSEQEIEFKARHDAGFGMDSMIRLMRELGIDISGLMNKPKEQGGPVIPGLGSPGRP